MSSRGNRASGLSKTQRLAVAALMAALALIFSYVEAIVPIPVGIPGVKLGLANLVVIIAIYDFGMRYAVGINVVRIIVNALLFTGPYGALYSLAGGLISMFVMWALKKTNAFSIIGVSMAGSVSHNFGQLLVAAVMISNLKIFMYAPVLVFSGIISGIIIGVLAYYIRKSLKFRPYRPQ